MQEGKPAKRARLGDEKNENAFYSSPDSLYDVSPDGPTPGAGAGAGAGAIAPAAESAESDYESEDEVGELGAPAIPVSIRSDTYSVKDPRKLTPAQQAELVEKRNEAVRNLLSTNAAPSASELRDAINAAEVEFYRKHLKSRFGGRNTRRKSKVRIPVKKNGDLTKLGYSMTKKARSRHSAIKKAVKKFGRATVSRKLNALAIFNRRRHPATARKARADRKYAMKV